MPPAVCWSFFDDLSCADLFLISWCALRCTVWSWGPPLLSISRLSLFLTFSSTQPCLPPGSVPAWHFNYWHRVKGIKLFGRPSRCLFLLHSGNCSPFILFISYFLYSYGFNNILKELLSEKNMEYIHISLTFPSINWCISWTKMTCVLSFTWLVLPWLGSLVTKSI